MVFVTLRNGKVLQYNHAESISIEEGCITLRHGKENWLLCRIPLEVVERSEFIRPCKIYREKRKDKLPIIKE